MSLQAQSIPKLLSQIPRNALLRSTRKAFLFSYLYVVLPKVIKKIMSGISKGEDPQIWIKAVLKTMVKALHPLKFPMLVARMIATMNVLTPIIERKILLQKLHESKTSAHLRATVISLFIAAVVNFPSFQNHIIKYNRYFSLDFTLILVTRALDTLILSQLPKFFAANGAGAGTTAKGVLGAFSKLGFLLSYGDGMLFVVSSFFIMHYWFFYPDKLPPAYHRWITSAAEVDPEIVHLFQSLKDGTLKYGDPNCVNAKLFEPLCIKYGQDPELADLVKHQPFSCDLLHVFKTKSCELHALWRFQRGFKFAFKLYGSINFIVWLIRRGNPKRLIINTIRSSTFLGAFIGLYWYSLCLVRSRLFPVLFPNVPRTRWDDTIAPAAGAMGCGFSCFIENAQRRKELSLFVAPRALGTLVPSEPTKFNLRVERIVFALSFMILSTFAKQDPSKVRGIMGKGLGSIFKD